jgi:hypothetical protein
MLIEAGGNSLSGNATVGKVAGVSVLLLLLS